MLKQKRYYKDTGLSPSHLNLDKIINKLKLELSTVCEYKKSGLKILRYPILVFTNISPCVDRNYACFPSLRMFSIETHGKYIKRKADRKLRPITFLKPE